MKYALMIVLLMLSGCPLTAQQAATVETAQQKAVYALDAALTSAETAGATYAQLPFCTKAAPLSVTNVCADPAVVIKIDAAAKKANAAVNSLESMVQNNPTVDVTSALSDAWTLVNIYSNLVSSVKQ